MSIYEVYRLGFPESVVKVAMRVHDKAPQNTAVMESVINYCIETHPTITADAYLPLYNRTTIVYHAGSKRKGRA